MLIEIQVALAKRPARMPFVVLLLGLLAARATARAELRAPDSAEVCGRCHRAIHAAWKASAHAKATEDPMFQDALRLAEEQFGGGARKACLGCHAPVAAMTGDLVLREKVSWEGVTCDYCHSIRDVTSEAGNAKAKVEFSPVRSGPSRDASSTVHGTAYSRVHTSSLACASCHEYKNTRGFPVLTTYTEWKNSPAAQEGRPCQSCHMYRVEGRVVEPRILRTSDAKVNLHQMPGSDTLEQLTRTVAANLSVAREGGQLKVVVSVTNRMAGHYVPTGSPLRQLVLELKVDSYDGQHFRAERAYRRAVADEDGKPLDREHIAVFRAARVLSDTRLAPGEKRNEEFAFPVPAGVSAQVAAAVWYFYSPAPRSGIQKRVTFLTLNRFVP